MPMKINRSKIYTPEPIKANRGLLAIKWAVIACALCAIVASTLMGFGVITEDPIWGKELPSGFLLAEETPELRAFQISIPITSVMATGPVMQMVNAIEGRPYTTVEFDVVQPELMTAGQVNFYVVAPVGDQVEIEQTLWQFGNLQ